MDLQLVTSVLLSQLPEGLFLDLAHALPRQIETLTDFFQRKGVLAADSEIESRNLSLTWMKHTQCTLNVVRRTTRSSMNR